MKLNELMKQSIISTITILSNKLNKKMLFEELSNYNYKDLEKLRDSLILEYNSRIKELNAN
jgi:hypothetical protein